MSLFTSAKEANLQDTKKEELLVRPKYYDWGIPPLGEIGYYCDLM